MSQLAHIRNGRRARLIFMFKDTVEVALPRLASNVETREESTIICLQRCDLFHASWSLLCLRCTEQRQFILWHNVTQWFVGCNVQPVLHTFAELTLTDLFHCVYCSYRIFVHDELDLLDLDLRDTGRTLHRYHAWVCGFRSGVTSPELLIMLSYCCLEFSKDCVSFITLGNLFQILGVLMKNECLYSSDLADFNL